MTFEEVVAAYKSQIESNAEDLELWRTAAWDSANGWRDAPAEGWPAGWPQGITLESEVIDYLQKNPVMEECVRLRHCPTPPPAPAIDVVDMRGQPPTLLLLYREELDAEVARLYAAEAEEAKKKGAAR